MSYDFLRKKKEGKYHFDSLAALSAEADLSPTTFRKRVRHLMKDSQVSAAMEYFPSRSLTYYQQLVLIRYMPELYHLQPLYEDDLWKILHWKRPQG